MLLFLFKNHTGALMIKVEKIAILRALTEYERDRATIKILQAITVLERSLK